MTTPLLENELVRKYFSCEAHEIQCRNGLESKEHMAFRVLQGMQEPIRHGELIIYLSNDCGRELKVTEYIQDLAALGPIHPNFLRLPDAHQKREKKPCCDEDTCCDCCEKKPDLMDSKINALMSRFTNCYLANEQWGAMREGIRELVALCKREFGESK